MKVLEKYVEELYHNTNKSCSLYIEEAVDVDESTVAIDVAVCIFGGVRPKILLSELQQSVKNMQ